MRHMHDVVDLNSDVACFGSFYDLRQPLLGPQSRIFPFQASGEEEWAGKDIQRLVACQDTQVVLHVLLHEIIRIINIAVVFPQFDCLAIAVALFHDLWIHDDVVRLSDQFR